MISLTVWSVKFFFYLTQSSCKLVTHSHPSPIEVNTLTQLLKYKMSADLSELPSTQQPHSLSANLTRSSGFLSYSHRDTRNMSMDELEEEYQQLRDENHQLQLRILGVNELARLLQDKNEQLQLVEEKNKVWCGCGLYRF